MEVSESQNNLYNSQICRLCAEENKYGYSLYTSNEESDFSGLINTYLPLKISDDGKYPRWVCPGCHLQVESTVQFFNLLIAGQKTLQELYQKEVSDVTNISSKESIDRDVAKGQSPTNIFPVDHEMTNCMSFEVTGKEKKKRGRPRKIKSKETFLETPKTAKYEEITSKPEKDEDTSQCNSGRKRRQIKLPVRYKEVVRGKELEKVYLEKGIIDKVEPDCFQSASENTENVLGGFPEEVIGHVKGDGGVTLGDLVVIKNRHRPDRKYGSIKRTTRFMCDICKICFYYEHKFLQHRLSHQNVQFECNECLKTFSERTQLIEHQTETDHQGEGIIEAFESTEESNARNSNDSCKNSKVATSILCTPEKCNEGQANKLNVDLKDIAEDANMEQICTDLIESEKFSPEAGEKRDDQSRILDEQPFQCDKCEETFPNRKSLRNHKIADHNEARAYICSKCGKSFRYKILLQRHQSVHSNIRPYICELCGSKYKTKQNLLNHTVTHTGEKKYECNICKQHFAYKTSLSLHLRWHKGDKPYSCSECGKGFTQYGNMQEHMRIHTGERPFECEVCGKKFKTSSQKRMHVKRHQVVRPIKCTMCDKTFVNVEEHKIHVRRHYNIKPFSCNICSKSFIEKCALKKHRRLHTGEKPYTCFECSRGFADRSNLKKHLKMHECKRKALLERDASEKSKTNLESPNMIQLAISSLDNKNLSEPSSNSLIEPVWNLIEETSVPDEIPTIISPSIPQSDQLICVTYQNPNDGNKTTLYVVNNTINFADTGKGINQFNDLLDNSRISEIVNDNCNSHTSVFLDGTSLLNNIPANVLLKAASDINPVDTSFQPTNNDATIEFITTDRTDLVDYPD